MQREILAAEVFRLPERQGIMKDEKEIRERIKIEERLAKEYEEFADKLPQSGWMATVHYQKAACLKWVLGA